MNPFIKYLLFWSAVLFMGVSLSTTSPLWAQGNLPTTDESVVDEVAPVPGDPVEIWDGDETEPRNEPPGAVTHPSNPSVKSQDPAKAQPNQKPSELRKNFWNRLSD